MSTRDLKHRQLNAWRRRFATEADWAKGFRFQRENEVLSSASQTDDDVIFAKTFVLLQSCYGIKIPPYFDDDGGLMDYGECIVLYGLYYSSRSFFFFFFFKPVKVNNDLEPPLLWGQCIRTKSCSKLTRPLRPCLIQTEVTFQRHRTWRGFLLTV